MNRCRFSALGSRLSALVLTAGIIAACSGGDGNAGSTSAATQADAAPSVTPTGKIITVEMYTDGTGNYFKPNEIEAHRGDIVRFVLRSGVHNVNFLPDSNSGKTGLPKASDFLQLPGQEFDVLVSMAPGKYYFQCDPHALLGMVGELEVEDEN
jgi:plastocyanin